MPNDQVHPEKQQEKLVQGQVINKKQYSPLEKLPIQTLLISLSKKESKKEKEQRQWVCIRFSKKHKKLMLEKYNDDEFNAARNPSKNKCFYLAYYIKHSEQNQFYTDAQNLLLNFNQTDNNQLDIINAVRNSFYYSTNDYIECDNYQKLDDFRCLFDVVTGEAMEKQINKVIEVYKQLEEIFNSKDLYQSSSELSKLLSDMKVDYESFLKKLEQYTKSSNLGEAHLAFVALEHKFSSFEISFYRVLRKIELNALKEAVNTFQKQCEEVLSQDKPYLKRIYDEYSAINQQVKRLLSEIDATSDVIKKETSLSLTTAVEKLLSKYELLEEKFSRLQVELCVSEEKNKAVLKVFDEIIDPKLEKIKNHPTSESKKEILEKIISFFIEIKDKIKIGISIKDIKEKIKALIAFIEKEIPTLNTSRGFFSAKSGTLVEGLKPDLEKIETLLSDELVSESVEYRTKLSL